MSVTETGAWKDVDDAILVRAGRPGGATFRDLIFSPTVKRLVESKVDYPKHVGNVSLIDWRLQRLKAEGRIRFELGYWIPEEV